MSSRPTPSMRGSYSTAGSHVDDDVMSQRSMQQRIPTEPRSMRRAGAPKSSSYHTSSSPMSTQYISASSPRSDYRSSGPRFSSGQLEIHHEEMPPSKYKTDGQGRHAVPNMGRTSKTHWKDDRLEDDDINPAAALSKSAPAKPFPIIVNNSDKRSSEFQTGLVFEMYADQKMAIAMAKENNDKHHEDYVGRWAMLIVAMTDKTYLASPIFSYGKLGVDKKNFTWERARKHAIIHTANRKPRPCEGEYELPIEPIPVVMSEGVKPLNKSSRLDFSSVYSVDSKVKYEVLGRVRTDAIPLLEKHRTADVVAMDEEHKILKMMQDVRIQSDQQSGRDRNNEGSFVRGRADSYSTANQMNQMNPVNNTSVGRSRWPNT